MDTQNDNGHLESSILPVSPEQARKRLRNPEGCQRTLAKRLRYSPKELPDFPTCGHASKSFRCSTLRMKADDFLKPTNNWHFKFAQTTTTRNKQRTKVFVGGELNYRSDLRKSMSVTKKMRSLMDIHTDILSGNNANLSMAKKVDLEKLLCGLYGENWRENENLNYYRKVLAEPGSILVAPTDDLCEPIVEDECILRV